MPAGSSRRVTDAASTILSVQGAYAARGTHLATAALAGASTFVEWAHYPERDCVDALNRSEFYYHAHAAAGRAAGEHGHFHVFSRLDDGGFCHLAGISLDQQGLATRLFTTNQWVTGESWLPTSAMRPLLDRFALRRPGRLAPVARWIEAMLRLYRLLILELMTERDDWLAQAGPGGREACLADRGTHIVTQRPISLFADLEQALSADR